MGTPEAVAIRPLGGQVGAGVSCDGLQKKPCWSALSSNFRSSETSQHGSGVDLEAVMTWVTADVIVRTILSRPVQEGKHGGL